MTDIEVIPFDAALGAEVRCGDVRAASDTVIARISQASLDHQVVLIRAQTLSDAELSAFGKRFGELQLSNPLPSPLANWCGTPICRASPRRPIKPYCMRLRCRRAAGAPGFSTGFSLTTRLRPRLRRAGDMLMWDNRCVMHHREPFDPAARRYLHRVVIKGAAPVVAP